MVILPHTVSLLTTILLVPSIFAGSVDFNRWPGLRIPSVSSFAVDYTRWNPPGPGDVRSPCPGLNALANHGILPHDGKNINIAILAQAFKSGLNLGADFAVQIGSQAMALISANAQFIKFDLDQLNQHNVIEHDGSLSRCDYNVSPDNNNYDFNQTVFDQFMSSFKGRKETSIATAAKAHYARVKYEQGNDKNVTYGANQYILAYGESALYLSTMGNPITGVAPLEYVRILFEEERFPYNEGWRPNGIETNMKTLQTMAAFLMASSGETAPLGAIHGSGPVPIFPTP